MEFYDLFRDLIGYIPKRLGFVSDFFYEALPLVLIASALFMAFFGLKYLSLWNGVTFFFLGLTLSADVLLPKRNLSDITYWSLLALCLIIGVLCAVFSKYLFRLQLVLTTFLVTWAALPSYITFFGDTFARTVSAIVALALAFLTVKYKYLILLFTTSFSGSFILWGVIEDRYGVPYKTALAILMGIAASAFQVYFNREQLRETYKDVKRKYKITKKTSEKAYHELQDAHEHHEVVKHYDLLIDEGNDPVTDPEELREYMDGYDGETFLECLELDKSKSVLEIGVGTGRLALKTAPLCKSLTGIDISPKTVERAAENLSNFENVKLVCGDFNSSKFKGSYDIIYSSLTFMHFIDKQKTINKIASMLNTGGRVVLSIDKDKSKYIDYKTRKLRVYPDSAENIITCLENAKLNDIHKYDVQRAVIITAKQLNRNNSSEE